MQGQGTPAVPQQQHTHARACTHAVCGGHSNTCPVTPSPARRGDPGLKSAFATRLAGSADLYHTNKRKPFHSINFVIAHDGFTLADFVSYNDKHNSANGEQNRECGCAVEARCCRRASLCCSVAGVGRRECA